jgi:hypothetical protein
MTLAILLQIIGSSTGNSAQALTILGSPPRYESVPESVGTGKSSPMPAESGHGGKANGPAIQFLN